MRVLTLLFALLPNLVLAAGGGAQLMKANNDLHDIASLQNGAKWFVNYCLSCHSAEFMRFNRIGADLGLSDEQLKQNLMFAAEKVGDTMKTGLNKEAAKAFFGVAPPDLSVIARARGVDWLYTYLMTFYVDEKRPNGVNNLVFKDVGMPHVLGELQGWQTLNHETGHLEVTQKGKLNEEEYRIMVRDLVNFLEYMGEPAKLKRTKLWGIGYMTIGFLLIFWFFSYLLKKEYWRDVH